MSFKRVFIITLLIIMRVCADVCTYATAPPVPAFKKVHVVVQDKDSERRLTDWTQALIIGVSGVLAATTGPIGLGFLIAGEAALAGTALLERVTKPPPEGVSRKDFQDFIDRFNKDEYTNDQLLNKWRAFDAAQTEMNMRYTTNSNQVEARAKFRERDAAGLAGQHVMEALLLANEFPVDVHARLPFTITSDGFTLTPSIGHVKGRIVCPNSIIFDYPKEALDNICIFDLFARSYVTSDPKVTARYADSPGLLESFAGSNLNALSGELLFPYAVQNDYFHFNSIRGLTQVIPTNGFGKVPLVFPGFEGLPGQSLSRPTLFSSLVPDGELQPALSRTTETLGSQIVVTVLKEIKDAGDMFVLKSKRTDPYRSPVGCPLYFWSNLTIPEEDSNPLAFMAVSGDISMMPDWTSGNTFTDFRVGKNITLLSSGFIAKEIVSSRCTCDGPCVVEGYLECFEYKTSTLNWSNNEVVITRKSDDITSDWLPKEWEKIKHEAYEMRATIDSHSNLWWIVFSVLLAMCCCCAGVAVKPTKQWWDKRKFHRAMSMAEVSVELPRMTTVETSDDEAKAADAAARMRFFEVTQCLDHPDTFMMLMDPSKTVDGRNGYTAFGAHWTIIHGVRAQVQNTARRYQHNLDGVIAHMRMHTGYYSTDMFGAEGKVNADGTPMRKIAGYLLHSQPIDDRPVDNEGRRNIPHVTCAIGVPDQAETFFFSRIKICYWNKQLRKAVYLYHAECHNGLLRLRNLE